MSETILIAKIEKAHGIRGAVLIRSFSEDPDAFLDYPLIDQSGASFSLKLIGRVKDRYICQIDKMATRNEAELLRGKELFTRREDLPILEEDEFYYQDIIGLPVFDVHNHALGKISAILNFGAGDLLEIQQDSEEILIPLTQEFVIEISKEAQKVVVELPDWVEANPQNIKPNEAEPGLKGSKKPKEP